MTGNESRPGLLAPLGRHALLLVLYGLAGIVVAGVAAFIYVGVSGKPDLKPWHTASLNEDFTRADDDRIDSVAAYRALEERLFKELQHEVYQRVEPGDRRAFNRYSSGSRADPFSYPENANRTIELSVEAPRAGVILIHGLTDSPYVFRALAARLHERGCDVVVLRLPGHGTAPAALTTIDWRDWAAAVRLIARDLRARLPAQAPLHMIGFSTGAALAVEYSLARLDGEDLPRVEGLVLLSPAIGVDPLAWLAVWQARLSRIPGLGKMAWLDLIPEYDPYKYCSFPVNAGDQIYRVTRVIDERLTHLSKTGLLKGFPRTLVFQSIVDATVSPLAVVRVFLGRLADEGHELVLFDINRLADAGPMLRINARLPAERLLSGAPRAFGVTLITNANETSSALVALFRPAMREVQAPTAIELEWPRDVFSLSHTALPIPPDDPVYGAIRPTNAHGVYLGRLELLGEQGLLAMPANAILRLRFNPFFEYEANTIDSFLALSRGHPGS
jgi:alpha-beta hydrolase superfamily lysophospholipase